MDERSVIKRSASQQIERDITSTPISTLSSSSSSTAQSFFSTSGNWQQRSECDDDDKEENDEDDDSNWLFECIFVLSYYDFKRLLADACKNNLILGWNYEITLRWSKYI